MLANRPFITSIRIITGIVSTSYGISLILRLLFNDGEDFVKSAVWILSFLLIALSAFLFPKNSVVIAGIGIMLGYEIVTVIIGVLSSWLDLKDILKNLMFIAALVVVLFFSVYAFCGIKSANSLKKFFFIPAILWIIARIMFVNSAMEIITVIIESLIILGTFIWQILGVYYFFYGEK